MNGDLRGAARRGWRSKAAAAVLAVVVGSGVLPLVPGPLGVERAEAQTAQDAR